jgi:hypothetical protein
MEVRSKINFFARAMKMACFILGLILTGCYPFKTSHDFDLLADFTRYKTYSFSERSLEYRQLINGERLLMAIETQMSKRGFEKSADPDVLVDLYVKLEQKEKTMVTTTRPSPWAQGYSTGFNVAEVTTENYREGALFISILDQRQKRVVWQGRGEKVVKEGVSAKARKKRIDEAVARIFRSYPFLHN